jgi:long-chain fatty acid transport protein
MKKLAICAALAAAFAPGIASATDGYFSHGWGMKAKGRGGASTAMTTDTFGGANNPATMVWVGDRIDAGVDWFRPDRSAGRVGSTGGFGFLDGQADGNETKDFFIPEFGYNKLINPNLSLGVSVYGQGGMNTDYPAGQTDTGACTVGVPSGVRSSNLLCGSGNLGVDLSQLIIAPTLAYKVAPAHSIGISPLIAYQRFKAYGLQPFAAISSDPANLTNKGYDSAWGWGVRVGWLGKLSETVSVGAAYSTKVNMEKFDKYRGLFAEQGGFDIPENFNVGIAIKATPAVTIAADVQRINYSKVKSVGNPSNQPNCVAAPPAGPGVGAGCLGASSASIGFGWDDVNAIKIGVEYAWNRQLTLRAGYNHTDNPIQARDVTFNILAPGIVQDHATLGFTYALQDGSEITMAYMHAFKNSMSGPATNPYFNVGGTETISLSENSLGIAWGKKF